MPAYEEEIEEALREGVELHELVAPQRILGESGRVTGIEMVRMRLGDADAERPPPARCPSRAASSSSRATWCCRPSARWRRASPARDSSLSPAKTVAADSATLATSREGRVRRRRRGQRRRHA